MRYVFFENTPQGSEIETLHLSAGSRAEALDAWAYDYGFDDYAHLVRVDGEPALRIVEIPDHLYAGPETMDARNFGPVPFPRAPFGSIA